MSLIRWNPLWDGFDEMENVFHQMPALRNNMQLHKGFVPAMDVYETKDAVVIETPLAGIRPEDVEVHIENGVLSLKGSHNKEHEIEEKNYYQKEIRSGSFFRQVTLPVAVKEHEIAAEFEDGILKITAPKASPEEPKKVPINIKTKK